MQSGAACLLAVQCCKVQVEAKHLLLCCKTLLLPVLSHRVYVACLTVLLQLDKAAADAAEFKAGFDKLTADNWEQKAQVRHGFMMLQHTRRLFNGQDCPVCCSYRSV
jgi:hypothetical protein